MLRNLFLILLVPWATWQQKIKVTKMDYRKYLQNVDTFYI